MFASGVLVKYPAVHVHEETASSAESVGGATELEFVKASDLALLQKRAPQLMATVEQNSGLLTTGLPVAARRIKGCGDIVYYYRCCEWLRSVVISRPTARVVLVLAMQQPVSVADFFNAHAPGVVQLLLHQFWIPAHQVLFTLILAATVRMACSPTARIAITNALLMMPRGLAPEHKPGGRTTSKKDNPNKGKHPACWHQRNALVPQDMVHYENSQKTCTAAGMLVLVRDHWEGLCAAGAALVAELAALNTLATSRASKKKKSLSAYEASSEHSLTLLSHLPSIGPYSAIHAIRTHSAIGLQLRHPHLKANRSAFNLTSSKWLQSTRTGKRQAN